MTHYSHGSKPMKSGRYPTSEYSKMSAVGEDAHNIVNCMPFPKQKLLPSKSTFCSVCILFAIKLTVKLNGMVVVLQILALEKTKIKIVAWIAKKGDVFWGNGEEDGKHWCVCRIDWKLKENTFLIQPQCVNCEVLTHTFLSLRNALWLLLHWFHPRNVWCFDRKLVGYLLIKHRVLYYTTRLVKRRWDDSCSAGVVVDWGLEIEDFDHILDESQLF